MAITFFGEFGLVIISCTKAKRRPLYVYFRASYMKVNRPGLNEVTCLSRYSIYKASPLPGTLLPSLVAKELIVW